MLDRLHGLTLAATITVVLVVKLVFLYLLHEAVFSPPPVKKPRMPPAKVEHPLPGAAAAAPNVHSKTSQPGSDHLGVATLRDGKVV